MDSKEEYEYMTSKYGMFQKKLKIVLMVKVE